MDTIYSGELSKRHKRRQHQFHYNRYTEIEISTWNTNLIQYKFKDIYFWIYSYDIHV